MLFFRAGNLWILGVAPLSIVVAVAAISWKMLALPEPNRADQHGLAKWLILRDVGQQPVDTQLALLDGLQREFGAGEPLPSDQLPDAGPLRARLQANLEHLQRLWFYTRSAQLLQVRLDHRNTFLDRQIAFAEQWGDLAPTAGELDVFLLIDTWLAEAEGEQREAAVFGVRAALVRFLQTHSLEDYPLATRQELAARIVEDLEDGPPTEVLVVPEDMEMRQRLGANALLLVEAWLLSESQRYAGMTPQERSAYLERRLRQFRDWNLFKLLNPETPRHTPQSLMAFAAQTQTWIERADGKDRPALEQLVRDITHRLLLGNW